MHAAARGLALLQSVLARLPVDARARACVVCRAWNAALAERSLWARLDLSLASGVAVTVTPLDVPAAQLLHNALRASTTLTSFQLKDVGLWQDPAATVVLLSALMGHQSLCELDVSLNAAGTPDMQTVAGATLGALVAVNAAALHKLDISLCYLDEAGLGPLVDALPHNTHLRTLECAYNVISEAFARDRLLPALPANTALRKLVLIAKYDHTRHPSILRELQDLVAARAAAAPQ